MCMQIAKSDPVILGGTSVGVGLDGCVVRGVRGWMTREERGSCCPTRQRRRIIPLGHLSKIENARSDSKIAWWEDRCGSLVSRGIDDMLIAVYSPAAP